MIIKTDNFIIEFMEEIKVRLYFMYKIRITCYKKSYLDILKINCNAGISLNISNCTSLAGYNLLQNCKMKKNEKIEGYIAYQKMNIATNCPVFSCENVKVKVKNLKRGDKHE
jgi:hypothetical protein